MNRHVVIRIRQGTLTICIYRSGMFRKYHRSPLSPSISRVVSLVNVQIDKRFYFA